jgi:uncharacterized protein YodC (DUF2158 family)
MKVFVRGDKVTTKEGKPATVVQGEPEGYVLIREQGKHRSVWSGNLERKRDNA